MGANGRQDLLELGIEEDHPGAAILDDEFELGPRQSPVEGHKNSADF